jgi:hypothetical protein
MQRSLQAADLQLASLQTQHANALNDAQARWEQARLQEQTLRQALAVCVLESDR